jgi:hypothetical protein
MYDSQLLQYFSALTTSDRRDMRKFVRSPYHNQREDVVRLFEYIDTHIEKGQSKLKKEVAFERIFPNTPFDLKQLNYTMSFLTKVLEAFLVQSEATQQIEQAAFSLHHALILRGASTLAERALEQAKNEVQSTTLRNGEHYNHSSRLHLAEYDLRSRNRRDDTKGLQEASDAFHIFTITEILRQACAVRTQQSLGNTPFEQPLLPTVLSLAATPHYLKISAISAYYHAYQALLDDAQLVDFQALRAILENDWQLFPETEMRGLYLLAINVCIRKINQFERAFEQEVLQIYRAGLQNKLLLENGQLSPYTYKNVMSAATKVGEFDWANTFLEEYKSFLPAKDRENVFRYNLALLRFRQGNTAASMTLLHGVNLREPLFQLDARRLLARLYYDAHELSALDSLIDSTKIYLHRQKDIGYQKEMYVHFFKILEKMLRTDFKNKKELEILRGLIEDTKMLAERDWLLEKVK